MTHSDLRSLLAEPARLRALTQSIRSKIPTHDVDDIVQSTLAHALTAEAPPVDALNLDRWLFGIARHKVADYYRGHRRHEHIDSDVAVLSATEQSPDGARDLLRWVHGELPADSEAPRTLEWMMREADGDPLESIARENALSAPVVRQRVSRLRRYLRERWMLQVAAALALALVIGIYAYSRSVPKIEREVVQHAPSPAEQAKQIRDMAMQACHDGRWPYCLEQLDRARALDPTGDGAIAIVEARAGAARALEPVPSSAPAAPADSVPAIRAPLKQAPKKLKPQAPLESRTQNSNGAKAPQLDYPETQGKGKFVPQTFPVQQSNRDVTQSQMSDEMIPRPKKK